MLGSLSCSFTSISILSNLICVLSVMLGSLSCSFTILKTQIRLESMDIDVNEHERLPNITLKTQIRLESKDIYIYILTF
jgi:hypothetical protein